MAQEMELRGRELDRLRAEQAAKTLALRAERAREMELSRLRAETEARLQALRAERARQTETELSRLRAELEARSQEQEREAELSRLRAVFCHGQGGRGPATCAGKRRLEARGDMSVDMVNVETGEVELAAKKPTQGSSSKSWRWVC